MSEPDADLPSADLPSAVRPNADLRAADLPRAQSHGGDGLAIAAALGLDPASVLDLSASLNPFAPDVPALAASHLESLVAYPDDLPAAHLLAEAIGVDHDRFVLTNGGAEAIALVARHLGTGAIVDPEFSLYRRHLPVVDRNAGRWRSNPSNPLGKLAAAEDEALVWDEAFYPLATGTWTRGDDRAWRLGSLTKLWACAGLRLGYAIAPTPTDAEAIRALQPRWAINGLALALLPELLAQTDLSGWAKQVADLRATLASAIEDLGFSVSEGVANWVLLDEVDAPLIRRQLATQGVIVRDCTNFGLPTTVRIALPLPADVDRVVSALASVAPQ